MTCKLCRERGKTWEGSDPQCAFEGEYFSSDNWNCATCNEIRDLIEPCGCGEHMSSLRMEYLYNWDEKCVVVNLDDGFEGDAHVWDFLFVQWYKSRGRTSHILLTSDDEARPPKEAEALQLIDYLKSRAVEHNHPEPTQEELDEMFGDIEESMESDESPIRVIEIQSDEIEF